MSDYKELCERLMDTDVEDLHGYAAFKVGQLLGEAAEAIEALQARVRELERTSSVLSKTERECHTLQDWRMRALDLEAQWSRCSQACARLQTERDALRAKLESLQRDLAARDATIAEMRERVKDYEDDYAAVVDEPCAPDEKHCTCVPILRRRIKELTAAEAKRFDLACAWRDTAERLKSERDALRAKLEAAALALENVQHGHVCPAQPGWLNAGPCTCGLDAALAAMGASAEREPVTSLASLDWPAP